MSEQKKSTEELLKRMSEHYRKYPPQKIESNENGVLLLDPQNPHHREWFENDEDYEVIQQQNE